VRLIASFLLPAAICLAAGPVAQPPATQPSASERRHVAQLSRQAADLIERRQFADALRVLHEALAIMPDNPTCLYDLACVHAARGQDDAALDDLKRAADAGFTDFTHLQNDRVFNALHDLPRYRELIARKQEFARAAAAHAIAQLKSQLGRGYVFEADPSCKLIFAVHIDSEALESLRRNLQVQATSESEQLFSRPRDEFVRLVIATPGDFYRFEPRGGVGGRYDDSTRTVLVKRVGPELRHEFTHALHAADQHALDQEHPVWLSEGLATLYEYPHLDGQDDRRRMLPNDTWRLARVQGAARHGGLIPLDRLLKMSRAEFTARADLAYGEAGSLLMYISDQGLLKKFYDAYTAGYPTEPTGRSALEKVTDMKLPELQKVWVDWLLPREVPSRDAAEIPD